MNKAIYSQFDINTTEAYTLEELLPDFFHFKSLSKEERLSLLKKYASFISRDLGLTKCKCNFVDLKSQSTVAYSKGDEIFIDYNLVINKQTKVIDTLYHLGAIAHELWHLYDTENKITNLDLRYKNMISKSSLVYIKEKMGDKESDLIKEFSYHLYTQIETELKARKYQLAIQNKILENLKNLNFPTIYIEQLINDAKSREESYLNKEIYFNKRSIKNKLKKTFKKLINNSLEMAFEKNISLDLSANKGDLDFSEILFYAFSNENLFDYRLFKKVYKELSNNIDNGVFVRLQQTFASPFASIKYVPSCLAVLSTSALNVSSKSFRGKINKQKLFDDCLSKLLKYEPEILNTREGYIFLKKSISMQEINVSNGQIKEICKVLTGNAKIKLFHDEEKYSYLLKELDKNNESKKENHKIDKSEINCDHSQLDNNEEENVIIL